MTNPNLPTTDKELLERYTAGYRNFREVEIENADFSNSVLSGADFTGAILQGANFERADLSGIIGVNLDNADLRGANLKGAKLVRAHLAHTELSEATFDADTMFPDDFYPLDHEMVAHGEDALRRIQPKDEISAIHILVSMAILVIAGMVVLL